MLSLRLPFKALLRAYTSGFISWTNSFIKTWLGQTWIMSFWTSRIVTLHCLTLSTLMLMGNNNFNWRVWSQKLESMEPTIGEYGVKSWMQWAHYTCCPPWRIYSPPPLSRICVQLCKYTCIQSSWILFNLAPPPRCLDTPKLAGANRVKNWSVRWTKKMNDENCVKSFCVAIAVAN